MRAVTERLHKIRQAQQKNGAGGKFSISGNGPQADAMPKGPPRKPRSTAMKATSNGAKNANGKGSVAGGKRKRNR